MPCAPRLAEEHRALAHALAASLLLHVAVLLALRLPALSESPGPSAAGRISAHLAAPAVEQPRIARQERRPARRTAPAAVEAPQPPAPPIAEPTVADADAGLVARYRQQLIVAAVPHKRYPERALDEGWEGDVLLHVAFSPRGEAQVTVKAGSGHALLDEQAIETFRAAAPQVPLPAGLRGQAFAVDVRASYSRRD